MDWIVIILIALGAMLLVTLVLYLTGQRELAKKIVLPFSLLLGLLAAATRVFPGSAAIREENERIKQELKKIKGEREALQEQLKKDRAEFEHQRSDLQKKVDASNANAKRLKDQIDKMKAQGAEAWYASLSDDEKREALKKIGLPPGLEDQFFNR